MHPVLWMGYFFNNGYATEIITPSPSNKNYEAFRLKVDTNNRTFLNAKIRNRFMRTSLNWKNWHNWKSGLFIKKCALKFLYFSTIIVKLKFERFAKLTFRPIFLRGFTRLWHPPFQLKSIIYLINQAEISLIFCVFLLRKIYKNKISLQN